MAGQAASSRMIQEIVRANVAFAPAGIDDEADIRRILRENPLGGRFRITLEREPYAYAGDIELSTNHLFIIGRDLDTGEAVGICERTVRKAFVNGQEQWLPYIGSLRIAASHRHRIGLLRGGYEALSAYADRPEELPFALTSITTDNAIARRLLTAGISELPQYAPVGEFSTFALRPRRTRPDRTVASARPDELAEIAAFLQNVNWRFQFSPVWTEADLSALGDHGLRPQHFLVSRSNGTINGCLAVWDQTRFRQTVIRGYPSAIERFRNILNLASSLTRMPRFPPTGVPLKHATFSHLGIIGDDRDTFIALVEAALNQAHLRGFDAGVIGLAAARPLSAALRKRLRAIEYRTTLYLAHWKHAASRVAAVEPTILHPELGLL